MAEPTTFTFGAGVVLMETSTPGTYAALCGFKSIEMNFNKDLADDTVPDCDDPDKASDVKRQVVSRSWDAQCQGVLAQGSIAAIDDAWESDASVNVRIHLKGAGSGGATPDRRYSGKAHVTASFGGEKGTRMTRTVTLQSDGALSIADVAALS